MGKNISVYLDDTEISCLDEDTGSRSSIISMLVRKHYGIDDKKKARLAVLDIADELDDEGFGDSLIEDAENRKREDRW